MTATFADSLAANRFQTLDLSRQGLDASRPNPFDPLPKQFKRRFQGGFQLEDVNVRFSPGVFVQRIVQSSSFDIKSVPFGNFDISVVAAERNAPSKVQRKYVKNGILVHHAGQPISSEDVANALAEE
jgi:hypothetical protein